MKKIIIALIAVVLVLTGGFIFLKSGDNNEVVNPEIENQEVQNQEMQNEEKSMEDVIKSALIAEGEWRPSSIYSGDEVSSLSMVYGTMVRHSGGISFYEDGTFYNSLIWYEPDQEQEFNYGKYEIDTETKKITYTFNSGNVMYGTYEEVDGVVTKIIYEEADYLDGNDYTVEFEKRTEEQKKELSLTNSLISARWIPTSANANGETVELTEVYGENYKDTPGIMFEIIGDFYKDYVTSDLDGIYEGYGFYWIDIENKTITYQLVKKEDGSRVDIIGSYEEENDEIIKITYTENFGTENEVEVVFEPVVF